jgi:hypothetical protein
MRIGTIPLLAILCIALSAPAFADLYNNGPTNGTSNLFFLYYSISDEFVPNASANMTSFDVALWVPTNESFYGVDWAVGTTSFGNDVGSGLALTASLTLLCNAGQPFNGGTCGLGASNVYDARFNVGTLPLVAGDSYWLTLEYGYPNNVGWDINAGPSLAYHNKVGQVPSESFTINGGAEPVPEPASIMLFGSGILGLAGMLRRKLN